jgi:hypothetical protein
MRTNPPELLFAKTPADAIQAYLEARKGIALVAERYMNGELAGIDPSLLKDLKSLYGPRPLDEVKFFDGTPIFFWASGPTQMVLEASETYPLEHQAALSLSTVMNDIETKAPLSKPAYLPHLMTAFCVFERPWTTITVAGQTHHFSALAWRIYLELTTHEVRLAVRLLTWLPGGINLPTWWCDGATEDKIADVGDEAHLFSGERLRLIKWVCAAAMFLQQELVHTATARVGGQVGKRASRDQIDPTCHVITLRHQLSCDLARQPGETDVEWSHRWIVRGHWRKQWFPLRSAHVPVWIHPYIKGPADKPLRVLPEVYAVAR